MKQKTITARRGLSIAVILFALCCALGLYFAIPKIANADGEVSIADYTLTLEYQSVTYTGSALQPAVTVKNGGETLGAENYTVTYENNINVGEASVTVTGKGGYSGTLSGNFTINKAEGNEWISKTVVVNGWEYGQYNAEANVFEVSAKYGSRDAKFTVYELGTNKEVTDLANAPAGTYDVAAVIEGNDNYDGITDETGKLVTIFGTLIIRKAENSWIQVPKVVPWEYGSYNKNVNLILGKAAYGTVKFTIRDENGVPVTVSFAASDGVVSDTMANPLSLLDAGTYYLSARVDGTNANYTSLELNNIELVVSPTSNDWVVYPDVIQWQYTQFDKNTNLFLASVNYCDEDGITFVVKESEDGKALTPEFTVTDGAITDTEVIEVLENLPRGTYYVLATVSVSDPNREKVEARGKTFEVYQAANGWHASPNVVAWQYGGFDPNMNLIIASPLYGSVSFAIYSEDEENLTGKFTATDGVIDDEDGAIAKILNSLHAGSYYLVTEVASDVNNNYAPINTEQPLLFNVIQAVNVWTEMPGIESWVKGKYNSETNAVTVEALHGLVDYVIFETTNEENIVYEVKDGEVIVDKLADAGVGYYTLKATVAESDDFSSLEKTFTFRIFEKPGLPWWAVLLIVVGSLGVVALVLFILHQKGVLQMLTGRFIIKMRAKMTIDATIAAIRANKVAEAAKITVAEAEAREKAEAEQAQSENGTDNK